MSSLASYNPATRTLYSNAAAGSSAAPLHHSLHEPRMSESPPVQGQFLEQGQRSNSFSNRTTTTTRLLGPALTSPQVTSSPTITITSHPSNLYQPERTEYIPPGQPLRGGMYPMYDTSVVRTYEAQPIFRTAPAAKSNIQTAVRNVSDERDDVVDEKKHRHKHRRNDKQKKKEFACC